MGVAVDSWECFASDGPRADSAAPALFPRSRHAAAAVGNAVYIFGGSVGNSERHNLRNDLWCVDFGGVGGAAGGGAVEGTRPACDSSAGSGSILPSRTAAQFAGKAAGGSGGLAAGCAAAVESAFCGDSCAAAAADGCAAGGGARLITPPSPSSPWPSPRAGAALVRLTPRSLLLFGGVGPPPASAAAAAPAALRGFLPDASHSFEYYSDTWIFDLDSETWTEVAGGGTPLGRTGHSLVAAPAEPADAEPAAAEAAQLPPTQHRSREGEKTGERAPAALAAGGAAFAAGAAAFAAGGAALAAAGGASFRAFLYGGVNKNVAGGRRRPPAAHRSYHDGSVYLGDTWAFDAASRTWCMLDGDAAPAAERPPPRTLHAAALALPWMYVSGGHGDDPEVTTAASGGGVSGGGVSGGGVSAAGGGGSGGAPGGSSAVSRAAGGAGDGAPAARPAAGRGDSSSGFAAGPRVSSVGRGGRIAGDGPRSSANGSYFPRDDVDSGSVPAAAGGGSGGSCAASRASSRAGSKAAAAPADRGAGGFPAPLWAFHVIERSWRRIAVWAEEGGEGDFFTAIDFRRTNAFSGPDKGISEDNRPFSEKTRLFSGKNRPFSRQIESFSDKEFSESKNCFPGGDCWQGPAADGPRAASLLSQLRRQHHAMEAVGSSLLLIGGTAAARPGVYLPSVLEVEIATGRVRPRGASAALFGVRGHRSCLLREGRGGVVVIGGWRGPVMAAAAAAPAPAPPPPSGAMLRPSPEALATALPLGLPIAAPSSPPSPPHARVGAEIPLPFSPVPFEEWASAFPQLLAPAAGGAAAAGGSFSRHSDATAPSPLQRLARTNLILLRRNEPFLKAAVDFVARQFIAGSLPIHLRENVLLFV